MSQEVDRIKNEYDRRKREVSEDFYSLEKPGNRYIYDQRISETKKLLQAEKVILSSEMQLLDIGCGIGDGFAEYEALGIPSENMCGMDLDQGRIKQAQLRFPKADIRIQDASKMPWPEETFDIVSQMTVFTSILDDEMKRNVAKEMLRVLKPSGVILWYDFFVNNPKNPNVKGVTKKEMEQLFSNTQITLKRITLAPPLARSLAPVSTLLCHFLEKLTILNTHYLGIIRKL